MTPWHVIVIVTGALLEAWAINKGIASPESVATIVALIIGAAAGNAQASRSRSRSTDGSAPTDPPSA